MATSGVIYNVLHALNLPVDVRNICVLLAPGFSALTAWATYMFVVLFLAAILGLIITMTRFTKEMKDESAGLLAAAFIGIVPGYISRSVAGSYDNEAIAIFLLMFTFYTWIKALKDGSAFFGTIAAVFYFYMVAAWGKCLSMLSTPPSILTFTLCRWLRLHYQHDSSSCPRTHPHGTLHESSIRRLLVMVCHRHSRKHAGPFCWIPARPDQRTHGGTWYAI
jgi:asparagine N-glycosylation enzyme membrane subunit Stt3